MRSVWLPCPQHQPGTLATSSHPMARDVSVHHLGLMHLVGGGREALRGPRPGPLPEFFNCITPLRMSPGEWHQALSLMDHTVWHTRISGRCPSARGGGGSQKENQDR